MSIENISMRGRLRGTQRKIYLLRREQRFFFKQLDCCIKDFLLRRKAQFSLRNAE